MNPIIKDVKNPVMIYKVPGKNITDGIKYDYDIIDESEPIPEGWFKTLGEANSSVTQTREARRNEKA